MPSLQPPSPQAVSTGIPGLNEILNGGFTPNRLYLVEGEPGVGKTTFALQYLIEGARRGESVMIVSLSESAEELREIGASHGWSLEGVHVRQLIASEPALRTEEQYTMFHPSEVELGETTRAILADMDAVNPTRVVFDSLAELRLLAGNALRYRRQIVALKQYFFGRGCTVLMLDDLTRVDEDRQLQTLVHGVVRLEQLTPEYGSERRRLRVVKFRGLEYRGGYHDFVIRRGGLRVFPRLQPGEYRQPVAVDKLQSGIAEFDALLGGGIERGTSTLLVGAAGTGKSSLAAQYATVAAERGEHAAMFLFDEGMSTLLSRCARLGIGLKQQLDAGRVTIQRNDPAALSPGEFGHAIRRAVDEESATVIVIDSLNGYLNAMPEERFLIIQLHELLRFLGQSGVATILIAADRGLIGTNMIATVDASYLADAVVLMRYFEAKGEVRQAVSVIKNRSGAHERTIREFRMADGRIGVGPVLREFRGVLTGVPIHDDAERLADPRSKA